MKLIFKCNNGRTLLMAAASSLLLAACGEANFKIKGEIDGADNVAVVLEKSDFHGRWIPVDSTRTSSSGSFTISQPAPAAPDVYRLAVDNKFIYFPIDSVESLSLKTTLADFSSAYTISGSEKAESMARFDKEVLALPANISADSLDSFKRNVYSKYIKDAQGSIVGYYVLTKTIGETPLFDPDNDYKYFAAVATGFKELRPNDPHTRLLEKTSVDAMRRRNSNRGAARQIEAEEIKVIDIELPDENGTNRRLSDYVGNGKPTVVMFTVLTHPESPAANLELSKLYERMGRNVNFYQVSLDPDQYAWRDAARNLPWITVFDADGEYSRAARDYNVSNLPTYFIYDAQGELKARAASVSELSKQL
jgi:hypothetical protein